MFFAIQSLTSWQKVITLPAVYNMLNNPGQTNITCIIRQILDNTIAQADGPTEISWNDD